MSARWRRYKRRSKRATTPRKLDGEEPKKEPRPLRVKTCRIKSSYHTSKSLRTHAQAKLKKDRPLIDTFEHEDRVTVVAEFAGFGKDDLKVDVKGQRLVISAENSGRRYHRSSDLPCKVKLGSMRVSCKNGVLELQFGKLPNRQLRQGS